MKLLRWAVAGAASASVYVVYRYSIGKKAKGEDIFTSAQDVVGKQDDAPEVAPSKSATAAGKTAKAKTDSKTSKKG